MSGRTRIASLFELPSGRFLKDMKHAGGYAASLAFRRRHYLHL